eukprot:XP_011423738.1 PREDICTED: cyclin-D1-binding protein 1 homolog [Crassostrea gigas]
MAEERKACVSPVTSFLQNIDLVRRQLRDDSTHRKDNENFDAEKLWSEMEKIFKVISHEATKISLAFCGRPAPSDKECSSLFSQAEKAILALVSLFYTLPASQGLRLIKSTKDTVLSLLDSMRELISNIQEGCAGNQQQLQSTGTVWQDANLFASMPKNDKDAVVRELKTCSQLIKDALEEIEEAIEGDGIQDDLCDLDEEGGEEGGAQWTESDKALTKPCVGLIKTTKSLIKKATDCVQSNGLTQQPMEIQELDKLAELSERLSPSVDDLIMDLYPPVDLCKVQEKGKTLFEIHQTVLGFLRSSHMTGEDDQKWLEFLLKANQHNYDNILKVT